MKKSLEVLVDPPKFCIILRPWFEVIKDDGGGEDGLIGLIFAQHSHCTLWKCQRILVHRIIFYASIQFLHFRQQTLFVLMLGIWIVCSLIVCTNVYHVGRTNTT